MSTDIFLKIDDIKGESKADGHADEIEVENWSWSAVQTGTSSKGGGSGAGRVQMTELVITKYMDKSSPVLYKMCCLGTHIQQVLLTARKAGGSQMPYLKVTLKDAMITNVSTNGATGGLVPLETIQIAFKQVAFAYTAQTNTGERDDEVIGGYDLELEKEWDGN